MTLSNFRARNHPQQVGRRGALEKVDDRRTPRELFDRLNEEFCFTLDVAASADNTLCASWFDRLDNGLSRKWRGSVWCNPPYSDCRAWVERAWIQMGDNNCESVVMLLPANRTEQTWWQEMVEPYRDGKRDGPIALETRFLLGRLRFDVPDGTYSDPRGNRPPFGVVLLVFTRTTATAVVSQTVLPAVRVGKDSNE